MSVWKLQCHFCGDTVSTGQLHHNYYKMHLEVVHNIQQHGENLLQWTLAQQSVEENVGSPVSAVDNIRSMKGISIQRSMDGGPSTPKVPVPGPLLNIKGITVQRVDEQGVQRGSPGMPMQRADAHKASVTAAQMRQQEQAINRWANGCEHGCRICRKLGKNFTSFTKQGLLKHLESEHEVSGKSGGFSERDYKEEFKCLNLITRASNTSCKECGTRIKRIPTSLNMHFKKHGLNIRTYWLKHLKPPNMPVVNGASPGRGIPLTGRGSRPRGRGGMMRGMSRPGIHKCNMPNCTRSFDNVTALNLHRSWHGRGGGRGAPRGRGVPGMQPVVVLNRVDGEEAPQEGEGDVEGEEMVMEMDPMDMLEVGIGEGDEDERGEEVEVDLDNLEVVDDDGAPKFGDDEEAPTFGDDDEVSGDPIEITPFEGGDESMNTPDMTDTTHEENENGGLNTPEPLDETEATKEEAQSDAESDIELVASFTPSVADPRMPIPLPDQTNDPPGTHIPPMTPPPIQRIPTPELSLEDKLDSSISISRVVVDSNEDNLEQPEPELDLEADLGLGPDIEFDEDGAPIIHKKTEEKAKVNILDQIENEIQEKIKSQEAAKAAEKAKVAEDSKSPIKLQVVTEASEIKSLEEVKIFREDSKSEAPNPEGGEPQAKKFKPGGETPPQETNQPGTPVKPNDSGQSSLTSTNGFNPVNNCVLSPTYSHPITSPTSHSLGPLPPASVAQPIPHIPYSTQSARPPMPQANLYQPHAQLQIPISHHDPSRMHPNQPYPFEPMPNREHYYPMQPPIPNQPPMMQPMQPNFYHPHQPPQHQPHPPPPSFPNQKQSRFFPYTGYATPIHTFNDTVEPGPDGRLPLDYWSTMSCTVDIPNCPLNCCHVRAHQEIMEGSTNWKIPYGPPLNGLQPCSCCINS
eukprot:GFUD01020347.1.p1 GENE.GFUD01020347.1~~GFUD01020347.1.p1  ORF type:complete len:912 (-),score=187.38 GFUD01020347.1:274-3009(-)